jgi:hypothetical protein
MVSKKGRSVGASRAKRRSYCGPRRQDNLQIDHKAESAKHGGKLINARESTGRGADRKAINDTRRMRSTIFR